MYIFICLQLQKLPIAVHKTQDTWGFTFIWLKETRANSVCTRQNVHKQYDKKEASSKKKNSFLWLKETRTNSVCTRQNVHNQYDKKEAANNFSYNQQVMG
jgi:hypothetical protein